MKNFADYPDILNPYEVSELLSISYKTCLKMIKDKRIPAKRFGRKILIAKAEILDLFDLEM